MEATTRARFQNVDEYVSSFPANVKSKLQQLRKTIKKTAPQAEELISYNIPAYKYKGWLVYFAGYKNHIGFYPGTSAIQVFKKDLLSFEGAKGTVRFPLDQPVPASLVVKIVEYKLLENEKRAEIKAKKTK